MSARRLNILMVTADFYPDTFGGVERCVYELSRGLAEQGHRVCVIARRVRTELLPSEKIDGFHVLRFPIIAWPLPVFQISEAIGAWYTARKALCSGLFDLVHVHEALPGSLISPYVHRRGIPLVYTLHAPWGEEWARAVQARRPFMRHMPLSLMVRGFAAYLRAIEQSTLRRACRVVALSRFTRDILVRNYGIPPERIAQIPGGVDTSRFKPNTDTLALRRKLGIAEFAFVLLTVRRLVPRMGIENLLRAVAMLKPLIPGLLLLVGGTGAMRGRLEGLVAAERLQDTVRFLGAVPDALLPAYYQVADLFVLPTLELEGFGLATLEALACGTPVVGTPAGATPEILAPLEPRLVARDVSAQAIAEAIRGAIEHRLLSPAMRERCRAYVEENYPWARCIEAHEALYLKCAEGVL